MYNFDILRVAILKRAVIDYKSAIRRKDLYAMAQLERFFRSDWGQLLSFNQGEYIISNCKRIAKK